MAATFDLELVSADRMVWSGEATMVITRTLDGEIGVLAHHAPLLGALAPDVVEVRPAEGGVFHAAIDGGFISVANNRISILSEHIDLANEIDVSAARAELERARAAYDDSPRAKTAVAAAEAKIAAAEKSS